MSQLWQFGALWSRYAGLPFLVDAGARRSRSVEFSSEQTGSHAPKKHHNIWLLFKIKHSVLTPAQKSQKRNKYKLILIIRVVVFITHIYNCGHDYVETQKKTQPGLWMAEKIRPELEYSGHISG